MTLSYADKNYEANCIGNIDKTESNFFVLGTVHTSGFDSVSRTPTYHAFSGESVAVSMSYYTKAFTNWGECDGRANTAILVADNS